MKKAISILLSVLLIFSCASVSFAGSWREAENIKGQGIRVYCEYCGANEEGGKCTGVFGCNCCTMCPGYVDETGVATNVGQFCGCRYDVFFDLTVTDKTTGEVIHEGTLTNVYYWKPVCCEKCTGLKGCQCNDVTNDKDCACAYCGYTPDDMEEKLQEGLEKGRTSFTDAIQNVLLILRDIMYDLFNSLFKFLRIDVILGPDKLPKESV